MAKYEAELRGDFYEILEDIHDSVIGRSSSATLEAKSDFSTPNCVCAVRVYERYSYTGQNRVSMNITMIKSDGRIFVSIITSGGSQGIIFKFNTLGESSFLDTVTDILEKYKI